MTRSVRLLYSSILYGVTPILLTIYTRIKAYTLFPDSIQDYILFDSLTATYLSELIVGIALWIPAIRIQYWVLTRIFPMSDQDILTYSQFSKKIFISVLVLLISGSIYAGASWITMLWITGYIENDDHWKILYSCVEIFIFFSIIGATIIRMKNRYEERIKKAHIWKNKIKDTEDVYDYMELIHPGLYRKILVENPSLNTRELQAAILFEVGFNPQKIAEIMGVSVNYVYQLKHSARKKLRDKTFLGTFEQN